MDEGVDEDIGPSGGSNRDTTYYDGFVPTDDEYQRLLEFRTRLRLFVQWSKAAAKAHGLTHAQHQLLLAVRGNPDPAGPTIGDISESLMVMHNTAGELVNRTVQAGLITRKRDEQDHRRVRLGLSDRGHEVLRELTAVHLEEVRRLAELMGEI